MSLEMLNIWIYLCWFSVNQRHFYHWNKFTNCYLTIIYSSIDSSEDTGATLPQSLQKSDKNKIEKVSINY